MSLQPNHFYEFGPFRLNVAECLLLRDGEVVPLTPKAFDLLLVLVEYHGRLLGKDELIKAVWSDTFVEEGNLSWYISHLRKALGDGENGQRFIETVSKRGYRFVGQVRESEAVGVNLTAPPQTGAEVATGVAVEAVGGGQDAFTGETAAEMMPAILKEEPPDLSETNRRAPLQLERVVRHGLEKRPEGRFQAASDLSFAIESLTLPSGPRPERAAASAMTESGGRSRLFGNVRLAWAVAGFFLLVFLAALPFMIVRAPVEIRAVRSFILPPEKASFNFTGKNGGSVSVSPDGRRLAFVATTAEGKNLLWVRSLDALSAQALTGTEGATYPFWSPDSRALGFFADEKLKRIEAAGGRALTLCDASLGRGGAWNRDGVIVFAPDGSGALHRVSASGGAASPVTKLDETRGETAHLWPYFLPDGRRFLYLGWGVGEMGAIYVASLDEPGSKLLLRAFSNAEYAQGYLLFVRRGTLMAQPFDDRRLDTVGEAFPIAEQVQKGATSTRGVFSVSEQGVLAYQTGTAASDTQLTWFDRRGKPLGVLGDLAPYINPQLSPDGKRAAVTIINPQTGRLDIWLYEVARGIRTRFTFDPAAKRSAIWSPDGSRIVFNSDRKGHRLQRGAG